MFSKGQSSVSLCYVFFHCLSPGFVVILGKFFLITLDSKRYSLGFPLKTSWRLFSECLISTYVTFDTSLSEWAISQRVLPKWLHDYIFLKNCFSWQTSGYRLCQASFGQKHVCFSCQLLDWFLSRFLEGSHMVISACSLDCLYGRIPGLVDLCFRIYPL